MSEPSVRIESLNKDERLDLLERLWDSLNETPADVPVTEAQRTELDRRSNALDQDVAKEHPLGVPWDEVVRQLRAKPPLLRPAAAADVEEAWQWYEAQREGLGDEFLEVAAPVVHGDIRRQLLRRFPYGLFYRIIVGQVVVVACFHAKRSPRAWRSRG